MSQNYETAELDVSFNQNKSSISVPFKVLFQKKICSLNLFFSKKALFRKNSEFLKTFLTLKYYNYNEALPPSGSFY